jgi:pyruvate formate lyase activating enzyme
VLSFGTAGCNLACKFCQNWDISKSRTQDRLNSLATPDMLASACVQTHCRSIAYTYNDPVIFLEYALDVAQACRARQIHNLAVTAGYICEKPRARFFADMDAANIDLKAFSDRFYKNLCGGRLAPVLDCLEYVRHETSCWLEITTLLIPGENDSPAELHAMTEWINDRLGPDVPLHFTAFHPDWKLNNHPATPPESLHRARAIAMENGLRYVYTGNIRDRSGGTTFCHRCGDKLIIRDGYNISHWGLGTDSRCLKCQTALPGVFEAQPGNWGNQRMPIHFTDAAPQPLPGADLG